MWGEGLGATWYLVIRCNVWLMIYERPKENYLVCILNYFDITRESSAIMFSAFCCNLLLRRANSLGSCWRGGAGASWTGTWGRWNFWVFKLYTRLAFENWATSGEVGGLIGLFGELALGVWFWEWATVLNKFPETSL